VQLLQLDPRCYPEKFPCHNFCRHLGRQWNSIQHGKTYSYFVRLVSESAQQGKLNTPSQMPQNIVPRCTFYRTSIPQRRTGFRMHNRSTSLVEWHRWRQSIFQQRRTCTPTGLWSLNRFLQGKVCMSKFPLTPQKHLRDMRCRHSSLSSPGTSQPHSSHTRRQLRRIDQQGS